MTPSASSHYCRRPNACSPKATTNLSRSFNQQRIPNGTTYDTRNLTQGSANIDAGDNLTDPIQTGPLLSLSDLAADILYNITSVTLEFTKLPHLIDYDDVAYTNETSDQIASIIQTRHENGWILSNLTKHYVLNETTNHAMQALAATAYRDSMSMVVSNRSLIFLHTDPPGPPWEDGGIGPWYVCLCQPGIKHTTMPPKGDIIPGSPLYHEQYNVTYERTHSLVAGHRHKPQRQPHYHPDLG